LLISFPEIQSLNQPRTVKKFSRSPVVRSTISAISFRALDSVNRVRLLTRPTLLDPNLMAIQMLGDNSPEYFRCLLTHMNLSRFLEVSSIPQLNNKDLYPRWFIMPPPDEQRAIAERIDAFHDLIRAKESKITALQRLKKSLMQNLLTGRMRLPAETIAALNAGSVG